MTALPRPKTRAGTGLLTAAVLGASAAFGPVPARAAAADDPEWITTVEIFRTADSQLARPETIRFGGWSRGSWGSWMTPEDLPPEYRRRAFRNDSIVLVDIAASGKAAGCRAVRPSPEPGLDRLTCELLVKRGRFHPKYAAPLRPIPSAWLMTVRWETRESAGSAPDRADGNPVSRLPAPAPPPPPLESYPDYSRWPRLEWEDAFDFVSSPDVQSHHPGGGAGEARVGLDLLVTPEQGATECLIGISSGNGALDEAACRVARKIELSYAEPCDGCVRKRVPLQIVWKRAGSHIRYPLHSRSRQLLESRRDYAGAMAMQTYSSRRRRLPFSLSRADYAGIADRTVTQRRLTAVMSIDSTGKPSGCRILSSSGNPAVDERSCVLLLERQRYTIRTDVFGDPAADEDRTVIDLTGLF